MHTCHVHVHVHVHVVNIAAAAADVLCWLNEADTEQHSGYREPPTTPLSYTWKSDLGTSLLVWGTVVQRYYGAGCSAAGLMSCVGHREAEVEFLLWHEKQAKLFPRDR